MGIVQNITAATRNRRTYTVGTLQARAYNTLTKRMTAVLSEHRITPKEWALLGLVYDEKKLQPTAAAEKLGIEAPYVTAMSAKLKQRKLLLEERDPVDTRAKFLCLSDEGDRFVEKMEPVIREHMRVLVKGTSLRDLLGYLAVLETIVKNEKK